ncbi:MAG: RDD family protein [Thermoanaerobaculia bacterium]
MELGPGTEEEPAEGVGVGHAAGSYGRARTGAVSLVPSERLWLRAAAFGIDLICLAGGPLLLATVIVFLVGLLAAEPPAGLPWVYRVGQIVFVVLFLLRDARGASPGKLLLGLEVRTKADAPSGPLASVLRNLPLLVPLLNLWEGVAVVRRPDARRLGDRLAGTNVGES